MHVYVVFVCVCVWTIHITVACVIFTNTHGIHVRVLFENLYSLCGHKTLSSLATLRLYQKYVNFYSLTFTYFIVVSAHIYIYIYIWEVCLEHAAQCYYNIVVHGSTLYLSIFSSMKLFYGMFLSLI
jgi:hypothetical protein